MQHTVMIGGTLLRLGALRYSLTSWNGFDYLEMSILWCICEHVFKIKSHLICSIDKYIAPHFLCMKISIAI